MVRIEKINICLTCQVVFLRSFKLLWHLLALCSSNMIYFALNMAQKTNWYIMVLKWLKLKKIGISLKLRAKLPFFSLFKLLWY